MLPVATANPAVEARCHRPQPPPPRDAHDMTRARTQPRQGIDRQRSARCLYIPPEALMLRVVPFTKKNTCAQEATVAGTAGARGTTARFGSVGQQRHQARQQPSGGRPSARRVRPRTAPAGLSSLL